MGEQKRRGADMTPRERVLIKLSRELADDGRLIEAGWIGLRIAAVPQDASEIQVAEMRKVFMAGAQYLFSSIMTILDPGTEATDKDVNRLDLIAEELRAFGDELLLSLSTEGSA